MNKFAFVCVLLVIGALFITSKAQDPKPAADPKAAAADPKAPLTTLEVKTPGSDIFTVTMSIDKDKPDLIKISTTTTSTNLKFSLRSFISFGDTGAYTTPLTLVPSVTPTTFSVDVATIKKDNNSCIVTDNVYLCHLRFEMWSGPDHPVILEVVVDGTKAKSVRFIPIYDGKTSSLSSGSYSNIANKISGLTFETNTKCEVLPSQKQINDDENVRITVRSTTDSYLENFVAKMPTHIKIIQFTCNDAAATFTKIVKVNYKVSLGELSKNESNWKGRCIKADFKLYNLYPKLGWGKACLSATIRYVLSDEAETFYYPIFRTLYTNYKVIPKAPWCSTKCYIFVALIAVLLILLLVFIILYFRNKKKQQTSYEESLAKPLTSEGSPYYELKQN